MKSLLYLMLCIASVCLPVHGEELLEELREANRNGGYLSAIEQGQAGLQADPANAGLLLELGRLESKVGRYPEARGRLESILQQDSDLKLSAQFELAEIYRLQGQLDAADELYRAVRAAWQNMRRPSVEQLFAIARATHRLGRHDPQMFKETVRFLDEVIRRDPTYLDAGITLAGVLLEKYNSPEALEVLEDVFNRNDSHPDAILMLARVRDFEFSPEALQLTDQALALNPELEPAHVLRAKLQLQLEDYDKAHEAIDRALEINPASLEALTQRALIYFLRNNHEAFREVEAEVLALNPAYADFYNVLADNLATNRLYQEAADFALRATELDALSWWGHGLRGINLLRLGEMEAGREYLDRALAGDPFNLFIKNKLDLMDHLDSFQTARHGAFDIVLDPEEDPLLRFYVARIAEEAWVAFVERYQYEPVMPIRIELYPDHADFSVRTVGLPGVGLLGVAFGPVVAMDSPSSDERGEFNWASTLWHEIAHVFHLDMTRNRVPRWFTEGLAVHEERRARPGWGFDVDLGFLDAYRDGRIPPLSQLNDGFVRPTYPQQIAHSYFQSSLVFEFIEERWGFQVVRDMLMQFRDSTNPENLLSESLGLSAEALDLAFAQFLQEKYATAIKVTGRPDHSVSDTESDVVKGNYFVQLEMGRLMLESGDPDSAEPALLRARDLLPEFAEEDSVYPLLIRLYLDSGRLKEAERELEAMLAINGEAFQARKQLASLRLQRDDLLAAAEMLEAANEINPFDIELHAELADIYSRLERWGDAVRERRAILALNPSDLAEARYQLAYALQQSGELTPARRQVIYALEIAPNYAEAQQLLLALIETPQTEGILNGQSN